jgi:hypothetical protein
VGLLQGHRPDERPDEADAVEAVRAIHARTGEQEKL